MRQIVQQPDGKYAVWCTIIDDFEVYDCTRQEVIRYCAKMAARSSRENTKEILAKLDRKEKPYYESTIPWREMRKMVPKRRKGT